MLAKAADDLLIRESCARHSPASRWGGPWAAAEEKNFVAGHPFHEVKKRRKLTASATWCPPGAADFGTIRILRIRPRRILVGHGYDDGL